MYSGRDIEPTGRRIIRSVVAATVVSASMLVFSGCSFDSAAGVQCDPADRPDGEAVCRDGRWIDPDTRGADIGDARTDGASTDTGSEPQLDTGLDGGDGDRADNGDIGVDGSTCEPGDRRSCYTAAPETEGTGRCRSGERTCRQDGTWGPCEGQLTPSDEQCGDQIDNDCDGEVDEADVCGCRYESTSTGVCSEGSLDEEGDCRPPETYQVTESVCDDGLDNDCDGERDDEDDDCDEDDDEKRPPGETCEDDDDCYSRCIDETCAHRVFVTSRKYIGDFGGLVGADGNCDRRATSAGAAGRWKAILSDSGKAARDRLAIVAPVVRWDGKKIADGANDLWDGTIDAPIELSEKGSLVHDRVWTGTDADGTSDGDDPRERGDYCADWEETESCTLVCSSIDGEAGSSAATNRRWIAGQPDPDCERQLPLYCIDGQ